VQSMILCESLKQTSQIYDLMMVAYSVSTQRVNTSPASPWCKIDKHTGLLFFWLCLIYN